MKANGTAVSVRTNNAYSGADIQLYSFFSLAAERCELSASYVSSEEQPPRTSWLGGWVDTKTSVDYLKKIKITVTARNLALELPAHCTAAILTDISQLFSTNMKDVPKIQWYWSSTNTLYFTRVMINIVAVSHDSAACYLMIWRHLLPLSSTLKKQAAGSSETVVIRYHSEQCHFPEHSNFQELSCFHGTRSSW